jgi:hypothetical protein
MKYICSLKSNKKPLTSADFDGLEVKSQIKLYYLPNSCCSNCNCNSIFEKYSNKIRIAKILSRWYFFCDDKCWANWCNDYNKFR